MRGYERKNVILNKLYAEKKVSVKDLSQEFDVSEETIRRDLEKLEKKDIVTRSYGGAMLNDKDDIPYITRHSRNLPQKKAIGKSLLHYIEAGGAIMADSSSTVHEALKMIASQHIELNIITNSVSALNEFAHSSLNIISTGGTLRERSSALIGPITTETIQRFNADIALVSCKAISMDGVSDANDVESATKKVMINQSKKVILIVDSTKFNHDSFVKMIEFADIDILITDQLPSDEWRVFLKEHQIEVIESN
ncbi:DeoR/GlpR family DNA-binding transcription regulator [Salipaludibacillus sp. HK11]|uniref:DeoR/GlpR family DNA-binding transcription regulator n=1 Tax=Salipaludibacillus sp. HK11 TaxID=3394320 RepID=UPI0039FDB9D5